MFLDCVDEPFAQLLPLAVHRQDAHAIPEANGLMTATPGLERAALLRQPALKLLTRHRKYYNTIVAYSTEVLHVKLACQKIEGNPVVLKGRHAAVPTIGSIPLSSVPRGDATIFAPSNFATDASSLNS